MLFDVEILLEAHQHTIQELNHIRRDFSKALSENNIVPRMSDLSMNSDGYMAIHFIFDSSDLNSAFITSQGFVASFNKLSDEWDSPVVYKSKVVTPAAGNISR